FSTILRRENGKHFLVTPVEKVGIRVDDAPFLAVEMVKDSDGRGRLLRFRTNVDDWVSCDSSHRLRFEAAADGGLTPYLHVRAEPRPAALRGSAGPDRPQYHSAQRRSGHRSHAGDHRPRTAGAARGGIDPGGGPSTTDRAVDAALSPSQRPRRPDFLSRRQDR